LSVSPNLAPLLLRRDSHLRIEEGGLAVAQFVPFAASTVLPEEGALETNVLDFKGALSRKNGTVDRVELAKDVAAFANADGGVILLGAYEDGKRGVLGMYKGLDGSGAKEAREAYSHAVRDYCFPPPIMDSVAMSHATGQIIAVNVWPFPGQAVGVRSREQSDAYFFPFRTGIDTNYLRAEQLPMLMIPQIRRIATLLRGIPQAEQIGLQVRGRTNSQGYKMHFHHVDELANVVVLEAPNATGVKMVHPLDRVESVWKDVDGWKLVITGYD
jgi:hypothetical protein